MTYVSAPASFRVRPSYLGDLDVSSAVTVQDAINAATSSFPDLKSALAYINGKWSQFSQLSATIPALQRQAQQVAVQAANLGHVDLQQQMQQVITYLGQLNVMQGNVWDEIDQLQVGLQGLGLDSSGNRVSTGTTSGSVDSYDPNTAYVFDYTDGQTLGQLPAGPWTIAIAFTAAVLLAGTIAYLLMGVAAKKQVIATVQDVVTKLANGQLTTQQAQIALSKIPTPAPGIVSSLQGVAGYLVLGIAAILIVPEIIKSRRS